jgi:lipoprotein-anchoring transpeptidase ErfK/SrfK
MSASVVRLLAVISALVLGLVAVVAAAAQEEPVPPATTGPAEPVPPPAPLPEPPPVPTVVPENVTIGGVPVGGLTRADAIATVQAAFDQPLRFAFKKKRWRATPAELGARAYVAGAVRRALISAPGSEVDLVINVRGAEVREYVANLDATISRPAKSSTLRLKKFKPFLTKEREGVKVDRLETAKAIVAALMRGERGPTPVVTTILKPEVTRANFGPVVVIRRESKKLLLYRNAKPWRTFGVATGQSSYPTPLGRWYVVVKQRDPWWYPPDSDWAEGAEPVPPGPGNPLGTRWMGLSAPLVGIHGTPDAASIGYSASHGCIRMRISDAEWLFEHIELGTPVYIVRA